MKRKKRNLSVLMVLVTLLMMLLPVSEADAQSSASDFRMEGSTLVKYRGTEKNVSIPSTVEAIGKSAFEDNKNVELVVVPNSVKRIDAYAFWGCDNLDSIVLGRGLSEVSDYAFAECTGLEQITIPANVTSIGMQAFANCTNLKHVTIPAETTSIHESAFEGCPQVVIHCEEGTVAEEYAEAFYERQKNMPGYGENSGGDAPGSADENPGGDAPGSADENPGSTSGEDNSGSGQTPEVPSVPDVQGNVIGSTHVVGNRAVVMMDSTRLQVYGSGQTSGNAGTDGTVQNPGNAGAGENVQTPVDSGAGDIVPGHQGSGLIKYTVVDGKTVADQAYYRSNTLGNVVLPEGIREIGEFAYARSSLTAVTLPDGVEQIGYSAFYHCDALGEVTLPDTVRCVEPKAFSMTAWVNDFLGGSSGEGDFLVEGGVLVAYRGNTADVRIPEGVRVIAGEAFANHGEIQSVLFPDSLVVVGEGAFEGCTSLGEITFGSNVEEIKDRAFLGNVIGEMALPSSVKKLGIRALGDTVLSWEGAEPEETYESSATRLSNGIYRVYPEEGEQDTGVKVEGLEEIFGPSGSSFRQGPTSLTGAERSYTLTVKSVEDVTAMSAAFQRALQTTIPEGMIVYDLELTDSSGIPLKKLGKQTLSVALPLAEALKGQELQLFALDSNGQLERLEAEKVTVDGVDAFRFETNYLSMVGVCGGAAESSVETVILPTESPVPEADTSPEETSAPSTENTEDKIPTEYKSALKRANDYSRTLYMSKKGIYDQLISAYGDKFSPEAAQYAVDTMTADWKENALTKAQIYSDTMNLSKAKIYEQLTSVYGEQFTSEEAQYAVDNVEADWKQNALEKAREYQDLMSLSPERIRDQLVSDYGEKFTSDEADYAIENLD